jgi:hypothetical protein
MSLRHEDHHFDVKHREQVFARLRAELLREAGNRASFNRVKARVLADREVQQDSALLSMIKGFIAEREAAFAAAHAGGHAATVSQIAHTVQASRRSAGAAHREAQLRMESLERQFHEQILHLHEAEAELAMEKMRALAEELPGMVSAEKLSQGQASLERLKEKRRAIDRQVERLATQAVAAARRGDHDGAAKALKRLSSFHALHPQLLSEQRFAEIRGRIVQASDRQDHREATRRLIERERAVATEIKDLAAAIHRFHKRAVALPYDTAEYRRAELAYHQAVLALKSHDAEWLAGLILDLVDLLSELHDPPPENVQRQVDHFVASVRSALSRLRGEVANNGGA